MKTKAKLIISILPVLLLLGGCESGSDLLPDGSGAGASLQAGVNNTLSVSPQPGEQTKGFDRVRSIKNRAETIAEDAPDSAAQSYKLLVAEVNTWISGRSTDAEQLATKLSGQVDMSLSTVADVDKAYAAFRQAAGVPPGTAESGAMAVAIGLVKAARQRREASATTLKSALNGLELKGWNEVRP